MVLKVTFNRNDKQLSCVVMNGWDTSYSTDIDKIDYCIASNVKEYVLEYVRKLHTLKWVPNDEESDLEELEYTIRCWESELGEWKYNIQLVLNMIELYPDATILLV